MKKGKRRSSLARHHTEADDGPPVAFASPSSKILHMSGSKMAKPKIMKVSGSPSRVSLDQGYQMDFENVQRKQQEIMRDRLRYGAKRNVPRWYEHEDKRVKEKKAEAKE